MMRNGFNCPYCRQEIQAYMYDSRASPDFMKKENEARFTISLPPNTNTINICPVEIFQANRYIRLRHMRFLAAQSQTFTDMLPGVLLLVLESNTDKHLVWFISGLDAIIWYLSVSKHRYRTISIFCMVYSMDTFFSPEWICVLSMAKVYEKATTRLFIEVCMQYDNAVPKSTKSIANSLEALGDDGVIASLLQQQKVYVSKQN